MLFFFNDTATTEIYTLSLHDALPIWVIKLYDLQVEGIHMHSGSDILDTGAFLNGFEILLNTALEFPNLKYVDFGSGDRKEHTSELQSLAYLVCRLLLEKKKKL